MEKRKLLNMIREKFHFSHRGTSLLRSNLVVKKWGGGQGVRQEVSEDTDEKDAEEGEEK